MDSYPLHWAKLGVGFGWLNERQTAAFHGWPQPIIPEGRQKEEGEATIAAHSFNLLPWQAATFLTFADTTPEAGPLAEFLARFGLGKRSRRSEFPPNMRDIARQVGGPDTSLGDWVNHWLELRLAVDLWRLLRKPDNSGLRQHIRWLEDPDGGRQVVYQGRAEYANLQEFPPLMQEVIASKSKRPEWLALFKDKDLIMPAQAHLMLQTNEHLAGQFDSVVLYDLEKKRPHLHHVPRTFLAGLWLQFAAALAADDEYRRCTECGAWFVLSPETARTNRLYCSSACRCRLWRCQVRARRMHQEGLPLEQIAAAVDSNIKTVRKWLKKRTE